MDLLNLINKEVNDFQNRQIQIVPGFLFNQYENIQTIYFYYNSKFQSGDIDDENDRKYFYNINRNPCKIFTKGIDFDTKDIRLLTVGGGDPTKTWFMERDLKYWMRDKQFGKTLNRIFYELPIFGSVVLKVVNGELFFVDLRNFIVEQSANTIDEMNYVMEVHYFTPVTFRKVAKDMKWSDEDVKKTIEEFHKMKDTSHIRVFERYGEVMGQDGTYTYRRTFVADVGIDEFDQLRNLVVKYPGVTLSSDEWEKHPYWEFHVNKLPGRWQGVGVVEELYEPQIAENNLTNLESKMASHLGLLLFQTRDPAFNRNLVTDTQNGEILNVDSELTQVIIQDRNTAFFNDQHGRWTNNKNDLTIAFAPVGHSVIAVQIAQDQVVSYFKQIQQDVALDIKEMIYEVIMPQFEKDMTPEHILRLVGQDLDQYVNMVKNELVAQEVIRQALRGTFPTSDDRDVIELSITESIKQGKEHLLTIPKGHYKGSKYDIDIDIMGESVDTKARSATIFAILQAITADPTALQDPVKKKFLYKMAEDGGLNPTDYFDVEQKDVADMVPPSMQRSGGGVSAPQLNQGMQSMPGAVKTV